MGDNVEQQPVDLLHDALEGHRERALCGQETDISVFILDIFLNNFFRVFFIVFFKQTLVSDRLKKLHRKTGVSQPYRDLIEGRS